MVAIERVLGRLNLDRFVWYEPWSFRSASRIFRVIGRENIGRISEEQYGPSGVYYYELRKNRLRLVRFTPEGSYSDPDPPAHQPHSRRQPIPTDQNQAK